MDDLAGKYISHSQHKDQQCGNDQYDFFYCCKCVHEFFVHFHTLSPFVYFSGFRSLPRGLKCFWIKKIRPLSGTDIKFRNHPVSQLKQARFCNVPAYATSVTGSTRENLLTYQKLSAFLLRDDIQVSSVAASHQSQLSEDGSSVFTDSLHGICFCYVLTL